MWRENSCAWVDWFTRFMKRHYELSLHAPELTNLARATCFDSENVKLFFSEQADMDHNKLGPELIWNIVETRMTTFKKPKNVFAAKRLK